MLTISSISVSPWPQQTPTVKAQPVSATKTSNAVSQDSAGVGLSVSGVGDSGRVQATYAPSALPPVDPAAESRTLEVPANTALPLQADTVVETALAQRDAVQTMNSSKVPQELPLAEPATQLAEQQAVAQAVQDAQTQAAVRFKGELPLDVKHPEQQALEAQINDLVPNLWKASGAAVEVLIGDDAKAAAAARAEVFDKMMSATNEVVTSDAAQEAADTYAAQAALASGQLPGSVVNENA